MDLPLIKKKETILIHREKWGLDHICYFFGCSQGSCSVCLKLHSILSICHFNWFLTQPMFYTILKQKRLYIVLLNKTFAHNFWLKFSIEKNLKLECQFQKLLFAYLSYCTT